VLYILPICIVLDLGAYRLGNCQFVRCDVMGRVYVQYTVHMLYPLGAVALVCVVQQT